MPIPRTNIVKSPTGFFSQIQRQHKIVAWSADGTPLAAGDTLQGGVNPVLEKGESGL